MNGFFEIHNLHLCHLQQNVRLTPCADVPPSVHIANFCSEPIQAVKETADGGMRKNWCGYKNNWLGRLISPIGSLWQLTVTAKRANRHGIGKIFEFHLIICSVLKLIRSRTGYVL